LVHVRRAVDRPAVGHGRERDRSRHPRARALGGVDDLAGALVQDPVVVRLQPDPDLFIHHHALRTPAGYRQPLPQVPYWMISVTVPAATVRPPSRIAKRSPFSIAMGAISSISICVLSPGITISVPAGRCATPVTSVVRK